MWTYDIDDATDPDDVVEPSRSNQGPSRSTKTTRRVHFGKSKFRRVAVVRRIGSIQADDGGNCELDSHADNSMLGRDARILEMYQGQRYTVFGYKKDSSVSNKTYAKPV